MRISKLFHWLYATLMFLPLLVAPIFAIFVRNENSTFNQELTVPKNEVLDFNQLLPKDAFRSTSSNGITLVNNNDGSYTLNGTSDGFTANNFYISWDISHYCCIRLSSQDVGVYIREINSGLSTTTSRIFQRSYNYSHYSLWVPSGTTLNNVVVFPMVFDLTRMYGIGNIPTLEEFNTTFPNNYYDYTTSKKVLITGGVETYNDIDVGSQFIYTLYNSTDKYLNFDSVLNLYQLDEWIKLNVFNGNAPLVWTIAWHYLSYWLILSIYWLCFDVIMYVPLLAHRWLDKASLE